MSSRLQNYVRTYRRRSSLAQQDVAFLLGSRDRARVCKYESGRRIPSLRTALALAAILDVSVAALFGGIDHRAQERIAKRIAALRSKLQHKCEAGRAPASTSKQMRWLDEHQGRIQRNDSNTQ
jgi:transcriptional regulator with XRE-family HTH domain